MSDDEELVKTFIFGLVLGAIFCVIISRLSHCTFRDIIREKEEKICAWHCKQKYKKSPDKVSWNKHEKENYCSCIYYSDKPLGLVEKGKNKKQKND